MKISIIIPSYNTDKYLEQCLESIFSQGYEDFEVIVVDGGSRDNSKVICEKYDNWANKLRWVVAKPKGEPDAINKGMMLATEDIVAFIDADDTYHEGCFSTIVQCFRDNPSARWIYGKGKIIDSEGKETRSIITRAKELLQPRYTHNSLLCVDYIVQPTVFMRRELFEQMGIFNCSLPYVFDYEYWLRLSYYGYKPVFVDRYLANWRAHSESLSVREYKAEAKEALMIQKLYSRGKWWLRPVQYVVYWLTVALYWSMNR